MPRWPKNYKKKHPDRDYEKETEYERRPEQVKRRVDRNAARRKAIREGRARKGDGMEVDHLGSSRKGRLKHRRTRVVTREQNRRRQPSRS
jgi:hypothetical protein